MFKNPPSPRDGHCSQRLLAFLQSVGAWLKESTSIRCYTQKVCVLDTYILFTSFIVGEALFASNVFVAVRLFRKAATCSAVCLKK